MRDSASSGLRCRVARPSDLEALDKLITESYSDLMRPAYSAGRLASALPFIGKANPKLLKSGRYFVVETSGGVPVGCGGWSPEDPSDGDLREAVGHLRHFAVSPDWVGRGVGRMLFEACLKQANLAGIRVLEVFASLNAVPFYESCGFRRLADKRITLPDDTEFDSVHMVRRS